MGFKQKSDRNRRLKIKTLPADFWMDDDSAHLMNNGFIMLGDNFKHRLNRVGQYYMPKFDFWWFETEEGAFTSPTGARSFLFSLSIFDLTTLTVNEQAACQLLYNRVRDSELKKKLCTMLRDNSYRLQLRDTGRSTALFMMRFNKEHETLGEEN